MREKNFSIVIACLIIAVVEQSIYFLLDHKDIISVSFVVRFFITFVIVLVLAFVIKAILISNEK